MDVFKVALSPFFLIFVFMLIELIIPQTKANRELKLQKMPDGVQRPIKLAVLTFLVFVAFIDSHYVKVIENPNATLSWGLILIVVLVFSLGSLFFEGRNDSTKAKIIQKLLLAPVLITLLSIGLIEMGVLYVDASLIVHVSAFIVFVSALPLLIRFREEVDSRLSF